MRRLRIKDPNSTIDYPEDVERIGKILYEKGYWSTPEECQTLWQLNSDSYCAGWLMLPKDDELIFEEIKKYIADD